MSSNLKTRTLTSVVYVLLMCGALTWRPEAFGALFLVVMSVALREFFQMSLGGRCHTQQTMAMMTGGFIYILLFCIISYCLDTRWLLLAAIPLLCIPASCLFRPDIKDFGLISFIYTGLLYVCLPFYMEIYLVVAGGMFNGVILLMLFIIIWFCDAGAYLIGSRFGQKEGAKKLAPGISPKKSWAGFWGGMVSGTLAAVLMKVSGWMPFSALHCIVIGLVVSLTCIAGDLVESLWKRHFGVKDSGTCIPGHGGMLDRFDSSLIAVPAAVIYMALNSLI